MAIGGLIGLTQNTGKREAARQELNTMMGLVEFKKQQEAEEQQAEIAYNETLAKVQEQANALLENDRLAITQKSLALQDEMKVKIKALGGTKKAFLKAGGISDLANYKKNIVDSQEFQIFKDNKINMERILMVKEKGMGHLLNEQDLKSLQAYNTNGSGKIQYTGLLNEIKVDVQAYELGHEITPEEVLANNQNRMSIIANYEADTQKTYNPRDRNSEHLLKEYIKLKGYGGVGRSLAMMQERLRLKAIEASKKAQAHKVTISKGLNTILKGDKFHLHSAKFENIDPGNVGGLHLGLKKDDTIWESAGGKGSVAWSNIFNPNKHLYKLKGGATFGEAGVVTQFVKDYTKGEMNENGEFSINPQNVLNTYDAKGVKLSNNDANGSDSSWEGGYVPQSFSIGYKGIAKDNEEILLMDPVNKKGEFDNERAKELYGDKSELEANKVLLVRMKGNNSRRDFYMEVPMDNLLAKSSMMNAMSKMNELSNASQEEIEIAQIIQGYDPTDPNATEKANSDKTLATINKQVDKLTVNAVKQLEESEILNSETFDLLTSKYNTDEINRSDLIKSFLLASANVNGKGDEESIKKIYDSKLIENAIEVWGLNDLMYNEHVSDQDIIKQAYDQEIEQNGDGPFGYKFASLWTSILTKGKK